MSDCSTSAFKVPEKPKRKECPFCGAKHDDGHENECFIPMSTAVIVNIANGNPPLYSTEQLTEAWNTRYEPTYKIIPTYCATGICSACGVEFTASIVNNQPPDYVEPARYCPSCGVRVEKVE